MLVRPMHQEWELWRWLAIISLAAALSLAFASAVGATDRGKSDRPPNLLPPELIKSATPMPGESSPTGDEATDLGCAIWDILELHRLGDHEGAAARWNELALPSESMEWKWIALAQVSIARGRLDQAENVLKHAMDFRPENAVAYYLRGVLRLRQAALAWDWPEDFGPRSTRLVTFMPHTVVPNTKSTYELAASMDFVKAIELAPALLMDETLIPDRFGTKAALEPTVRDLLIALGAEKFVGDAHVELGSLFLKRGALEVAEHHLDAAAQEGINMEHAYRDLGDAYRDRGQNTDAARAFLKALISKIEELVTL